MKSKTKGGNVKVIGNENVKNRFFSFLRISSWKLDRFTTNKYRVLRPIVHISSNTFYQRKRI